MLPVRRSERQARRRRGRRRPRAARRLARVPARFRALRPRREHERGVGGIIRWKRPESVRARRRRRGFHRTLERRLARVRAPAAQARRRARRRRLGLARSPRVRARARGMDGRHHHRLGRAFVVVLARICKSM